MTTRRSDGERDRASRRGALKALVAAVGRNRGDAARILAGSTLSGAGAYGFHLVATRALEQDAFAPVGVLWTIQYLVTSVVLFAIEAQVVRSRADTGRVSSERSVTFAHVTGATLVVGTATILARHALFPEHPAFWAPATASVLTYGHFVIRRGRMAGAGDYRAYASATAADGLGRLILAMIAMIAARPEAFAWALPAAPLFALLIRSPAAAGKHDDNAPGAPAPNAALFLGRVGAGNALAQGLLAGGPLLVVGLGAPPAEVSIYFLTFTLARMPLVLLFNGLLSRLLPPLTRAALPGGEARQLAIVLALGSVATAAALALLAIPLGPPLIAAVFGDAFRPSAPLAAAAAAGTVLATGALLLNHLVIARREERRLPAAWACGFLAAALSLIAATGMAPAPRVAVAFVVGEAAALLTVAAAAAAQGRQVR